GVGPFLLPAVAVAVAVARVLADQEFQLTGWLEPVRRRHPLPVYVRRPGCLGTYRTCFCRSRKLTSYVLPWTVSRGLGCLRFLDTVISPWRASACSAR